MKDYFTRHKPTTSADDFHHKLLKETINDSSTSFSDIILPTLEFSNSSN